MQNVEHGFHFNFFILLAVWVPVELWLPFCNAGGKLKSGLAGQITAKTKPFSVKPRGRAKVVRPGDVQSVARLLSPASVKADGVAIAVSINITVD